MTKVAKLLTQILCFEKYKHLAKRVESPVFGEGHGFIQNEKQLYFHENANSVSGMECLPLNSYVIFGKLHILFELQSSHW